MNKKTQDFIEKEKLSSSEFYIFKENAIINFQDFYKVTNQGSLNLFKNSMSVKDNKIIGIKFNPMFQLGIFQLIDDKYVLKKNIVSQNTGIHFLESILAQIKNNQNDKIDIVKLSYQAFEKQAVNKADLSVSDIYGPDSSTIGIPGYILASSLGMVAKKGVESYQKNQIIRSILIGSCLSIAQITGLNALKHKITTVVMLENSLNSIVFNQYLFTLLNFYNHNAKILFKNQNNQAKS